MRTTILLFQFLFLAQFLFATHNRAGEITYKQLADRTLEATITTYTKTSSTPADRDSLQICWGDGVCQMLSRVNGPDNKGETKANDFKVNVYVGVHQYQDYGSYTLSMTDPNRNGSILNVNAPNSDQIEFHLESTFLNLSPMSAGESNQSPILLEAPIDIGFVRQPFTHTPNAVDLDGDSIAYELVSPLRGMEQPVPNFAMVNEIGAGPENTFSFDEQTGLFTWTNPQIVGEYNIAILVKAYRNGELIDKVLRDMQILIMPDDNSPPVFLIEDDDKKPVFLVQGGQNINFPFTVFDREDRIFDGTPQVTASGEVFTKGATFVVLPNLGNVVGEFRWETNTAAIRDLPYQVVIKAVDSQGFATYSVLRIKVVPFSTSTYTTFKEEGYQLFPNPAKDKIHIQLPANQLNDAIDLAIFDNLGRLVLQREWQTGEKIMPIEISDLKAGIYFMALKSEDSSVSTSFVVE